MGRWILVLALVAVGCTSEQQRHQQALEQSVSWLTATSVALDHWIAGRAPAPYTQSTLRRAHENVLKLQRDLAPGQAPHGKAAADVLVDAMSDVEYGDRDHARAASSRLRDVAETLRRIASR